MRAEFTQLTHRMVHDYPTGRSGKTPQVGAMAEITGSNVNIKQCASENFLQFVNWLRAQIERQVQDPMAQAKLIKEMAQWNANETCRRVILGLPIDLSPTLAQIIEACTKKAELFSIPKRKPGSINPRTAAAVSSEMKWQQKSAGQLQHTICFQCKKPGHFIKECPQSQQQKKKHQKDGTTNNKKTRTRVRARAVP
ncbi:hypothetical protein DUI87_20412 [Hirundo rustica rustica]|uniref:Gag polyprotein n=1 Tax=Hirundo rustica rustica TaxID=333673 RepID=A0A3M0JQB8_HIRRU|nr:hypothetical protein DUI87_20412 [Hirundo rustica rustica]